MSLTATKPCKKTHREIVAESLYSEGALVVDGATELDGNVDMNGTLVVDGAATVTGLLTSSASISVTGSVTATTSFIIGSADLNETDLEKLDGITNGTAAASKALVADTGPSIAGLLNVGMAGTLTASGATGVNILAVPDNLADAWTIKEASTEYLSIVTTNSSESIAARQRLTTTDGVASGTAKVVGGRAYSAVSAADDLLASAGASAHVNFAQDVTIPANTLKAGSHVKIRGMVRVTDASGTDTLEVKLYFGPNASETTLLTTTAFDPDAAGDFVMFEFDLWSRAAPGAAVGVTGYGSWVTLDGSTLARGEAILAPANFATNGALKVEVSAKWSATTANTNARLEALDVEIL